MLKKIQAFAMVSCLLALVMAVQGQTGKGVIVKTLIFASADAPVLVMASGPNRVDLDKVAQLVGAPVKRANADQVREWTGFSIGGVPPVAHAQPITSFVDRDLLQHPEVWAAAGTPNTVFPIHPEDLVRVTGATVADVKQ